MTYRTKGRVLNPIGRKDYLYTPLDILLWALLALFAACEATAMGLPAYMVWSALGIGLLNVIVKLIIRGGGDEAEN